MSSKSSVPLELADAPQARSDLSLLQNMAVSLSTGYVKNEVVKLVNDISSRLNLLEASNEKWKVKVKLSTGETILLTGINPASSIKDLVTLVYDATNYAAEIKSMLNERTGIIVTNFEDKESLIAKGFRNLDTFLTEFQSNASTDSQATLATQESKVLQVLQSFRLLPTSHTEAVFLSLHCCLKELGFDCIAAAHESSVAGFAPPMKELPKTKLVPDGWNANPTAFSLLYKHKSKAGKHFSFTVLSLTEDKCIAALSEKNGESKSMELNYANVIYRMNPLEFNEDNLMEGAKTLAGSFIAQPPVEHKFLSTSASNAMTTGEPPLTSGVQPRGPQVGRSDVYPTMPQIVPGSVGDPYGQGSLVGPYHPYFSEADPTRPDHYLQPRGDPFYPMTDPNALFFPPQPNGGRGVPPPGRGRGRGGRGVMPRGDPDHDHLRPPDISDWYT